MSGHFPAFTTAVRAEDGAAVETRPHASPSHIAVFPLVILLHCAISSMKTVRFHPDALKDLRRIPAAKAIVAKIQRFAETGAGDVKMLTAAGGGRRLRIGDYRAIFDEVEGVIMVTRIRHRSSAYE
jgi:mRNA interferase RelE/StbE